MCSLDLEIKVRVIYRGLFVTWRWQRANKEIESNVNLFISLREKSQGIYIADYGVIVLNYIIF